MPLLAHTLATWLQAFSRVTLVVRPAYGALQQAVESALPEHIGHLDWVVCPDADRGMGISLAGGVAASTGVHGWLIGLADMPAVPLHVITGIRQAIADGAPLAAPFCDKKRGHPVGFSASYRDELLALDGDQGARRLIERDMSKLQCIETTDAGILMDIDVPSDLIMFNS